MGRSEIEIREIRARLAELGPWFSAYDFGDGLIAPRTAPKNATEGERDVFEKMTRSMTADYFRDRADRMFSVLEGAGLDFPRSSLIDLGCADGYFAIEARKRGFRNVTGMELRESSVACGRYAAELYGLDSVTFQTGNVYECEQLGKTFDVVLCLGLFYHLRHPILALEKIRAITGKAAYFAGWVANGEKPIFEMQFEDPKLISNGDHNLVVIPSLSALRESLRIVGYATVREIMRPDLESSPLSGGWREFICTV